MVDIVVIDDQSKNRDDLTALAMSVEDSVKVTPFADPRPLLTWCRITPPDLVIVDAGLAAMSVPELIQALRAASEADGLPVLLIASADQRAICNQALEAGAADFLLRPLDEDEFRLRARRLLSEREASRPSLMAGRSMPVRMRRRTDRDPLTDLPKRSVYRRYLDHVLTERLRREADAGAALFVIDLDRFKGVNDAFGLAFGDLLLRQVAERLAQHHRETEIIGYLGGDVFAVLQEGGGRGAARAFAANLAACFDKPFLVDGEAVHISASVGITLFPRDGQKADRLLGNAELAVRRAKAIGRNASCFFAPRMNMLARRTGLLERELRAAVAADQFTVHYQPRRSLLDDRILGMEALLRWRHPRRGMIRPTEFIGLAETIGLINPLTERVLDLACREHRGWIDKGFPPLRLAVNFSPIQFREEGVVDMVQSTIERTGIPPDSLEIELTEGVMLEDSRVALDSLTRLNDLGVTFSLDDFGTGYSSLSYIRRLPIQRLKIDQSFVQRLGRDGQDEAIVRAIIDLGHSLELKITGEGVETGEQLRRLAALGCDEVQGDLISSPLPAEAFERLLEEARPRAMAVG